jgi:putative FmdB family regulatory protein
MPVYDYICSTCHHRTEVIHGREEAGPKFCPACGAEGTMRKGFSAPSIVFKGSGWAKKDRATSAHRTLASRSAATDSGGSGSSDAGGGSRSGADTASATSDSSTATSNAKSDGGAKRSGRTDRPKSGSTPAKSGGD